MPKKQSPFTNEADPLYFRLDAQPHETYSDKAVQRVKSLRYARVDK